MYSITFTLMYLQRLNILLTPFKGTAPNVFFDTPESIKIYHGFLKPIKVADTTNKRGLYSLFVSLSTKSGSKPCSPLPPKSSSEFSY